LTFPEKQMMPSDGIKKDMGIYWWDTHIRVKIYGKQKRRSKFRCRSLFLLFFTLFEKQ